MESNTFEILAEQKREQTFQKLGYYPQSEIVYNELLPNANDIDDESSHSLQLIKENLLKAVVLKDIRDGCVYWSGQLTRYIRLYGYKFSKEDHVVFIKLFYGLFEIENLEMPLVDNLISVLMVLLKKKHLIKRDKDLVLDWKILHKLMHRLVYSKEAQLDLLLVPQSTQNKLKNFIRHCAVYFDVKSTQEMLNEWRPMFCAYDMIMMNASTYIELFLPTLAYDQIEREQSWMLWKDEFLSWWLSVKNGPRWERRFINLFARLSNDNIGYIDWSECVAPLFTRILRVLQLPVGKLQLTSSLSDKIPLEHCCLWLVSMLGSPSTSQLVLFHLEKLMKSIETFFHPSNFGSWLNNLSTFVYSFLNKLMWRVFRERQDTQDWKPKIPEDHRIKDSEVEKIITIFKPAAFMLLYNKGAYSVNMFILQMMNQARPDLMMPSLIEKTFVASDSLTEPYHFRACLSALSSMLYPSIRRYTEVRKHIIPLLIGCLPGLDPNDLPKTVATFKLMNTCMVLVPMVDCSVAVASHMDLTEEDRDLCLATAQFEDFVTQFFDRCLTLIENLREDGNNNIEQHSMLHIETAFKSFIIGSTGNVLHQSSKSIVTSRLRALFSYSTTHLFEGKAALSAFAGIVASCTKVNPAEAFSIFLPHYCQSIVDYCHDNPLVNDKLDKQFAWNMKILIEITNVGTIHLLAYKDMLFEVAEEVLKLNVKEAYKAAACLLKGLICAMVSFYCHDRKNLNTSELHEQADYLAIKDWGKIMPPQDLKLEWHIPTEEEFEAAFEAVDRFLTPTLDKLYKFSTRNPGEEGDLKKEEILNCMYLVYDIVISICGVLPFEKEQWTEHTYDSPVNFQTWIPITFESLPFYERFMQHNNRASLRLRIFQQIQSTLNKLLKDREDDVEAMLVIVSIYGQLSHFQESAKSYYNDHCKFYNNYKMSVSDYKKPTKHRERTLLITRTLLQQEMRSIASNRVRYTPMMHQIMLDLLRLSVSRYAKVRINAQSSFFTGLSTFPLYLYKAYLPIILSYLDPANQPTHEQHKGALYLLMGKPKTRMFLAFYLRWEVMIQVWPAILRAPHSDKPSIQNLSSKLLRKLSTCFVTIAIENVVPQKTVELSMETLLASGRYSEAEITAMVETGEQYEKEQNEKRRNIYENLVNELVDLRNSNKLTWRLNEALLDMLLDLIRIDVDVSSQAVKLFTQCLCDESLGVRTIAINSMALLMKTMKRKHKMTMRTLDDLNIQPPLQLCAGQRPDNEWLVYKTTEKPDTKEKYEAVSFFDKTYLGFYAWPKLIKERAPLHEQPRVDRTREELTESEIMIWDMLTNQQFVDQFVKYMCLEREKTKNVYSYKLVEFYRGVFRNFGDSFLSNFKSHIEEMVKDKRESYQRCAAEMIAGIVSGSKHWQFDMIDDLRKWLIPLLRVAITNISSETLKDWDLSFQEMVRDRDPRRVWWILDFVIDQIRSPSPSALVESSKLFLAQGVIGQQQWRVPDLLHNVVHVLNDQLNHPYKSVRSKMGSLLSMVYLHDLHLQGKPPLMAANPILNEMIISNLHHLAPLLRDESVTSSASTSSQINMSSLNINNDVVMTSLSQSSLPDNNKETDEAATPHNNTDDDRNNAIRVFKTFMKIIVNSQRSSLQPFHTSYIELLPYLCRMYPSAQQHSVVSSDDELNMDTRLCMSCLAQSLITSDQLKFVVTKIDEISTSPSWHMRLCLLPFIQVFMFVNLFVIRHHKQLLAAIRRIVMSLLEDHRYEVSNMAGITLSGLIRCDLVQIDKDLLALAHSMCGARLRRKKSRKLRSQDASIRSNGSVESDTLTPEELHRRHAGVLILSSCILSSPYTVPDWMPDIVMSLSSHLHEPPPIQTTVKQTFSEFRRTHHDNWHEDKYKFSSEQRAMLTDLLVSPNYYA